MLFRITVTPESYARVRASFTQKKASVAAGITSGIHAAIINLQRYIKQELLSGQMISNRSGTLRGAIFERMESPILGAVFVGREAPYARFLNDGTRPHIIFPKAFIGGFSDYLDVRVKQFAHLRQTHLGTGSQVLAWAGVGGKTLFARFVHHPGNMAFQFMEIGLEETSADTVRIIRNWVLRGLKGDASGD